MISSFINKGFTEYVPTVTSTVGALGTVERRGRYTVVGSLLFIQFYIKIVSVGSGSGYLDINLPIPSSANGLIFSFYGRETMSTGYGLQALPLQNPAPVTGIRVVRYDNASIIGTNYMYLLSGFYEID